MNGCWQYSRSTRHNVSPWRIAMVLSFSFSRRNVSLRVSSVQSAEKARIVLHVFSVSCSGEAGKLSAKNEERFLAHGTAQVSRPSSRSTSVSIRCFFTTATPLVYACHSKVSYNTFCSFDAVSAAMRNPDTRIVSYSASNEALWCNR